MEDILDYLLTSASKLYELSSGTEATVPEQQISSPSHTSVNGPSSHSSLPARFARPVSNDKIIHSRLAGIPQTTKNDTKYCVNVWEEWRKQRQQTWSTHIPELTDMTTTQLSACMTRFILKAREKYGTVYPPNTLHHLVAGLMRHLRQSGKVLHIFRDAKFSEFSDAKFSLQSEGVGSRKRQAEVITEEEENLMWEKGLLGDTTPRSLLDSMVFYCGLCFALHSGKEHRQLRNNPCQIELVE